MDPVGMESLLAKLQAAREVVGRGLGPASGPAAAGGVGPAAGLGSGGTPKVDFGAMLKRTLDGVDAAQSQSTTMAEKFQLGDPSVTLEETMVAVQKASLSFQQLVQIRNRVVAAYHDVMNMQV
jgi:flagellar hook-basal body complex protein FliE